MNLGNIDQILESNESFWGMLIKILLVIAMAQVVSWHYIRFANVLSNKRKFARVLVFITVTTLLVISVVKTSLALSLGLVGALSIIRFRTPIKEPEELAYLFLAIAIGIGVGADRVLITVTVFAAVLIYLSLYGAIGERRVLNRSLLQITAPLQRVESGPASGEHELKALRTAVESVAASVNLRRVDRHEEQLNVTLLVDVRGADEVGMLLAKIHDALPEASVSVMDRDSLE